MRVPVAILALVVVAQPIAARDKAVTRGPVPPWVTPSAMLPVPENASGSVFVRRNDLIVHLADRKQAQYLGYRIKILQSSALQLGNIALAWDLAGGEAIVHGIKLFRDGQAIDVLKTSAFEILRREGQLEAAQLDGRLTAVLRVPDLRVGDEIEVELTIVSSDPTLGSNNTGLLALGQTVPPGRHHIGLSWETAAPPKVKATPDMDAAMAKSARAIDWRFDNPPVLSPPKDAPPRYQWQRAIQYTDFADWAALSRHFAPLYARASTLAPGSVLKREAARIAAATPDPLARAAAALKLVQQDVRYVYVGLNGGNLTPATAEQTWQRRYGDCKGKTVLLLALLAELGIDAEPVLVNSAGGDDGYDQRLPIPHLFNHVLVRARIGGASYWLDGTLPPVAIASPQPVYPLQWVLPLTAQGSQLEHLAWQPAAVPDEITLFDMDARAGFDQPAKIVSTTITRGIKGLQQQAELSALSSDQLLNAVRQNAIGDTWQKIDDVKWRYDEKAAASVLTISGTGTIDWDDEGSGGKSLALPGGGFSPPERRIRPPDQDQAAPYYSSSDYTCHVTTVRLPRSTQPGQWSSKPSFDTTVFGRHYHRAWELRDGAIRMVRGARIEQPEIVAAIAQRDNDRIANFDNSMGWIEYDPSAKAASVGNGERVPATDEIDWTAIDPPCIASRPAK